MSVINPQQLFHLIWRTLRRVRIRVSEQLNLRLSKT